MTLPPLRDDVRAAVRVPGTTANLGPGFDALGMAVSRHLVATAVDRGDVRVTTTGEGAGEVPEDDDNLVWASLVRCCEAYDVAVPEVSLEVANALPLERGLGSSSAAIVAGLLLARQLADLAVGDLELVTLATEVEGHPDNVAPALLGGFVSATVGSDGALVVRRAQPDPRTGAVVAVPTARQNTGDARAAMPDALDRAEVTTQAGRAVHVAGALTGTWPVAPAAAGDLLHEPARFAAMPASAELVAAWRDAGLHAWLSGAGPAVAAAVPRTDTAAHERAVALARAAGFTADVLAWDLSGATLCPVGGCAVAGLEGCVDCPRRGLCSTTVDRAG